MIDTIRRSAPVLLLTLGLTSCTGVGVDPLGMEIVKDVSPIRPMDIERVCVRVNTTVDESFTDGIFDALQDLGMRTQSMQTAFAGECPYWLRYDAAWSGFPTYLSTATIEVYEGSTKLGHVFYDARKGSGRPDRFGSATGKVRPLIEGMFHHVVESRTAP
ncbi:MAG: hypothetical protein GVY21_02405 [Gammaproteobacteria bacterium]|jgi:hypothetical protein|nr:hypothetical protein [Gammaproteobacteria bacterium]